MSSERLAGHEEPPSHSLPRSLSKGSPPRDLRHADQLRLSALFDDVGDFRDVDGRNGTMLGLPGIGGCAGSTSFCARNCWRSSLGRHRDVPLSVLWQFVAASGPQKGLDRRLGGVHRLAVRLFSVRAVRFVHPRRSPVLPQLQLGVGLRLRPGQAMRPTRVAFRPVFGGENASASVFPTRFVSCCR